MLELKQQVKLGHSSGESGAGLLKGGRFLLDLQILYPGTKIIYVDKNGSGTFPYDSLDVSNRLIHNTICNNTTSINVSVDNHD